MTKKTAWFGGGGGGGGGEEKQRDVFFKSVRVFEKILVIINNPVPEYVCLPLCASAHWFCCTVLTIISTRDITSHWFRLHLIILSRKAC